MCRDCGFILIRFSDFHLSVSVILPQLLKKSRFRRKHQVTHSFLGLRTNHVSLQYLASTNRHRIEKFRFRLAPTQLSLPMYSVRVQFLTILPFCRCSHSENYTSQDVPATMLNRAVSSRCRVTPYRAWLRRCILDGQSTSIEFRIASL